MDRSGIEHPRVELIGSHLRAEGSVALGRFTRVSDYVNFLTGFFNIEDVTLLSRIGEPTRITFPEFRVRLDEIAIVGQHDPEASPENAGPWGDERAVEPANAVPRPTLYDGHGVMNDREVSSTTFMASAERENPAAGRVVEKQERRLVISTAAHIVSGFAHLHAETSMMAFLDATDPRFIPLTDVRVRWLADRRLAGRFPFALIQRDHIVGVATEGSGDTTLLGAHGLSDSALDPWGFEHAANESTPAPWAHEQGIDPDVG